MAGKALNPSDTTHVTTVKPPYAANAAVARAWYKDCSSPVADDGTQPLAADLNMLLYNMRYAADNFAVVDDDGEDFLYRLLNAAGWPAIFITTSITKTVGPSSDFADLNAAFDWLKTKIIVGTAYVTLSMTSGVHNYSSPIVVDYRFASRVKIIGAALLAAAPVGTDFTCTGSGSGPRGTDATAIVAMLRTKYATEIRFSGTANFQIINSGLGLLDKVLIVGSGTGAVNGLYIDASRVTIGIVSSHGFSSLNIAIWRSSDVDADVLTGSGNTTAQDSIQISASALFVTKLFGFCSPVAGIHIGYGSRVFAGEVSAGGGVSACIQVLRSTLELTGSVACLLKQSAVGIRCNNGKVHAGSGSWVATNIVTTGFEARNQATISARSCSCSGAVTGWFADTGSFIDALSWSGSNTTNMSPAVNTVGSQNSYIYG